MLEFTWVRRLPISHDQLPRGISLGDGARGVEVWVLGWTRHFAASLPMSLIWRIITIAASGLLPTAGASIQAASTGLSGRTVVILCATLMFGGVGSSTVQIAALAQS